MACNPVVVEDTARLPEGEQMVYDGKLFPLVMSLSTPEAAQFDAVALTEGGVNTVAEVVHWVADHRDHLKTAVENHGAVLFRGFPLRSPEHFRDFLQAFHFAHHSYIGGGGPRNIVVPNSPIYNSTDTPADFKIPFHHEMSYLSRFPEKLIFFCDVVPAADGETPIVMSNELLLAIESDNPEFVQKLRKEGCKYVRFLADKGTQTATNAKYQKGWQDIYETEDREEAEIRALDTGTAEVEWQEDGTMKVTTEVMEGVVHLERAGHDTWFNAITLLHPAAQPGDQGANSPWDVLYGSGDRIADDDVRRAKEAMVGKGVAFKWRQGDVLVVDNRVALHARNSFVAPRRILAAFGV